jgi:hypothetical protein
VRPGDLRDILDEVAAGRLAVDAAMDRLLGRLQAQAFEDLGFARVDHQRELRQGFPEVVFGPGKSPAQVAEIASRIVSRDQALLVTRVGPDVFDAVRERVSDAEYAADARAIVRRPSGSTPQVGRILVAAAGTSDLSVAEEAAVCADVMGNAVDRLYDVGVAGLHRLLSAHERLAAARVAIVVAGMEGALPSVLGGLVGCPVIAVPTSVGYGASFGGLAALLAMLNSCAAGVAVVNIDNGFGAAAIASRINQLGLP